MIITIHGKKDPLFKGVAKHNGIGLVFFGWSAKHVQRKEKEWLIQNMPVANVRVIERPRLRVIAGGKRNLKQVGK